MKEYKKVVWEKDGQRVTLVLTCYDYDDEIVIETITESDEGTNVDQVMVSSAPLFELMKEAGIIADDTQIEESIQKR